ncbi:unnamed protein product [Cyclocybe aegerita]|uniref:Uncharacterized protein n=1 Tax=Cyclocybe aegerita TaxID=1973307 RepID=A0A8S0W5I2_CYCAE|nr:unnamed protein product [Cyclocybe aegerita]
MLFSWLLLATLSIIPWQILAQETTTPKAESCTYSCPEVDSSHRPLVKRPFSAGPNSFYTIFECTYYSYVATLQEHTCSYNKHSGFLAIGGAGDECPPKAVACPQGGSSPPQAISDSEPEQPPLFSKQEKDEVPAWIEMGRYLLWLKEHHS